MTKKRGQRVAVGGKRKEGFSGRIPRNKKRRRMNPGYYNHNGGAGGGGHGGAAKTAAQYSSSNHHHNHHHRRRHHPHHRPAVRKDPNLLHVFHSPGIGAGGKDLPSRESTENTHNTTSNSNGNSNNSNNENSKLTDQHVETGKRDNQKAILEKEEVPQVVEDKKPAATDVVEEIQERGGQENQDVEMEKGDDDNNEAEEDFWQVTETPTTATAEEATDLKVGDSFFTQEPFTEKELEAVEESVKEQMEQSVTVLEKEGYSVFKKWRNKTKDQSVAAKAERKRVEQAIQDAKITGAPREYQQQLFQIACKQNIIIHLGTGAGKTLIALMTIRHFAKDFEKGKQTLFMVPSVALAVQQSTVLRANLPYKVQVACYSTSTTAAARKSLQECRIVVATHGAIHDLLMHYGDMFQMKNFNLLCIDECHYAIGSHSYATVMKSFFHTLPKEDRPRVLGLTASPLIKVKPNHTEENLAAMLDKLESILTAKVVSPLGDKNAYQVVPSLQRKPAEERDILYTAYQPKQPIPSFDDIKVHYSRERELAQLSQLYVELGPLVLSIYCQTLAREVSRNTFERESKQQFQNMVNYFQHIARVCEKLCRDCPVGGRSDKLLALESLMEEIIEDNGSSDTVVLIFVERRITAMALNDFFRFRRKATAQQNWIRASEVRKETPVLLSNAGSPTASRRPSSTTTNSSTPSLPSAKILEASPTNSMNQFADAPESDVDITTTVSVEQEVIAPVPKATSKPSKVCPAANQFDDASDDESQGAINQYLDGIRGQLRDSSYQFGTGDAYVGKASDQFADYDDDSDSITSPTPAPVRKAASTFPHTLFLQPQKKDCERPSGIKPPDATCIPRAANEIKERLDDAEMNCFEVFDGQVYWKDQFDDGESMDFSVVAEKETIRCQALVRNSTQIFKSLNKSRKLSTMEEAEATEHKGDWLHTESCIRDVLGGLRRGDINVLIATSVVEEGVDVQACSCVVAFDSLPSGKSYVQMRGRARAKDAKFFVFREVGEKVALSLDSAQEIEKKVHNFIASRTSTPVTEYSSPIDHKKRSLPPCKSDCEEIRAVEAGIYRAANGSVDMLYAKSLVNRYVLSLPIDPAARASKASLAAHLPSYTDRELSLPSHLPSRVRTVRLPPEYWNLGTREIEQILAMMACVRLHKHGLLSDRLLPLTRNDLQEMMLEKATEEPREIPLKLHRSYGLNGTKKRRLFVYPMLQKNGRISELHKILKSKGHSLAIISTEKLPNIPTMQVAHSGFGTVTCSIGHKTFPVECSDHEFEIIKRFFKMLMDSRWRRRTKNVYFRPKNFDGLSCMVPPYFVVCLGANGKLDFSQMVKLISESRRSEAERIEATKKVEELPEPRLWAPLYDKNFTYICYGPSGKECSADFPNDREGMEKIVTYKDYFLKVRNYELKSECLLYDAQRLWVLPFAKASTEVEESDDFKPKKVTPSVHSTKHVVCKDLKSLLLPKDACMEIPMADPNFLLLATHLPQFLNHMQMYLTANAFTDHCRRYMPRLASCLMILSAEQIAETLTAKSCAEEDSYDKLEWVGDAVLKLVQTDSLIYSRDFFQWIEFLHEGDLSTLRSVMGRNDRLALACKKLKLDHFLLTAPLGRGQWTPATLELYSPSIAGSDNGEGEALGETIGFKTRADVIEAILGICYLECGYEEATAVAAELEISLPQLDDKEKAFPDRCIRPKQQLLEAASSFTGHSDFKRPDLVQEAFTHPTAMHPETPSYQRLEWVGDAVLCLAVREWIYKGFPSLEVGQMVSMEASLVSNETLAFLAIKHGLLQHLDHCDQTLPGKIDHQHFITEELARGLWGTDPPKVAADVVEALLGAVYLDSGFGAGVAAVSKVLSPLSLSLEQMYAKDNNITMMHPRKGLQEVGGSLLNLKVMREEAYASQKPDARVWLGRRWGAPRFGSQHYVASIECLDCELVSVADVSSEVAGNRACAFAVAVLKRDPSLLARVQLVRKMVESSSTKEKKQAEDKAKPRPALKEGDCATGDQKKATGPVSKQKTPSPPKVRRGKSIDRLAAKRAKGGAQSVRKSPEQMVISVPDEDAENLAKSVAESVLQD